MNTRLCGAMLCQPSVSVSALSDRWCELVTAYLCEITSFVSVSALSDRWCEPVVSLISVLMVSMFQYPLCRIDGVNIFHVLLKSHIEEVSVSALSDRWCELADFRQEDYAKCLFQYPLCRIDGVNPTLRVRQRQTHVSVSALSDRWCEHANQRWHVRRIVVSVSALSDRWCEPTIRPTAWTRWCGFSIRSVGSMV